MLSPHWHDVEEGSGCARAFLWVSSVRMTRSAAAGWVRFRAFCRDGIHANARLRSCAVSPIEKLHLLQGPGC